MISDRIIADHRDPESWLAARDGRIGASDAAKFAKLESAPKYVAAKLAPAWVGSNYSEWGNEREPVILADHGYEQNTLMFGSETNPRYVATPDAVRLGPKPRLAQVKTTVKDFRSKRTHEILVPPNYRRQVWWEQFVMGPEFEETDFIYEMHHEVNGSFVPDFESTVVTIARDDAEIAKLVAIADIVLHGLDLSRF